MASLGWEEKQRILRALEEDREFRYALMGLLGYKEILEQLTEIRRSQQKLEERMIKLEERQQKLEERMALVEEEMRDARRVLAVIAHRFGVISEEAFREAMRYVVEEALGAGEVERWVYKDEEGVVYGFPSIVEADVLVRDDVHVLVEVKSRVSGGDVLELKRIGELYEKATGFKPRLVIVGGFVDEKARRVAKKIGVEVKPVL